MALDVEATPEQALLALRDDRRPFALVGEWAGGGALVGSEPLRLATGADEVFGALAASGPRGTEERDAGDAVVGGGWFGCLGFGLGRAVERLSPPPPRPAPLPDASLAFYDHLLRQDGGGRWWFEALPTPGRRVALERRLALLVERLRAPAPERAWALEGLAPRAPGYAGHRAAVAACVERIAAGEIYQANVCLRFEGRLCGAAIDAFAAARPRLRPPLAAFFALPGGAVLSFSPELFLRRAGDEVQTAPIKGTAPRSEDPAGAADQRDGLLASAKDLAENVMITDLMRNDLGRVCRYGSVAARPPHAEAHPGVWHLVSSVRGRLRGDVDDGGLVRAAFPPGSVTGAPKVQALEVIAALEATGRETYTGAIGFASPVAGLELNVAIRTFEVQGDRVWLGAGGGIVADSDPDAEVAEAWRKAAPLAHALGVELARPPPARETAPAAALATAQALPAAPPGRPRVPAPHIPRARGPRPDPALGLVETLAVSDGVALRLDAHLARLAHSAAAVLGGELPDDLAARVRRRAGGSGRPWARLRVAVARAEDGTLACAVQAPAEAAPGGDVPVTLAPLLLPGGLGEHKWADRRLVDVNGPAPLLVDLDGAVLEAGWANVWLLEDDVLVTPPADGRLLPGIVRSALPAAAASLGLRVREERLTLDRLRAADGVVLTSSVRLATPATLEGAPRSSRASQIAALLREGLCRGGRPARPRSAA
ncbi:MAG: chorismate-binding protein [Solirubrobacteraceae bacterium MAG38_C4-C5]|nr:chorismate-binding protein [Candidatus Siliceabacter maunaloa]